jgi:hypothetical protein
MDTISSQIGEQGSNVRSFGPPKLLTASELCAAIGVTPSWVYKAHQERRH